MKTSWMVGLVLVWLSGSTMVFGTILDMVSEALVFTSAETLGTKATMGSPADRPLDMTADGLGCNAVGTDNAYVQAWVRTKPIALGSYRQPWYAVNLSVEIEGFVDESGYSCVSRVFVRHSPDQKNWTTWHALFRKTPAVLKAEAEESKGAWGKAAGRRMIDDASAAAALEAHMKRVVFTCDLAVPRSTREAYNKLLAEFAATHPPRPKFQEDAVRWILAREPHYFEKDPPFIGYVEVLVEVGLGQSPRRLKAVRVFGMTLVDELMGHLTDANRAEFEGRWNFVAQP